jgi:hypothetical protein
MDVMPNLRRTPLCAATFLASALFFSCALPPAEPRPGPDKQGGGILYGAAVGAGSGAVTGAQISAGTGPGAWVGAGLGAVYGFFTGLGQDLVEEDQLRRREELQCLEQKAWVQEVISSHYQRRMALHPNRDIFPADLFFQGEGSDLKGPSVILARELGLLTQRRVPSSRILIASYVTGAGGESSYASYLSEKRAEELALKFVESGMEPRRLLVKGVVLAGPLLVDPYDSPGRYRQAIEIIPLDN